MISAGVRRYRITTPKTLSVWPLYRWAFVVRVLVGLLAYTLTLYADLPIVEDARFYEEMGYEVARDWLSGTQVDFDALPEGVQSARFVVMAIAGFYYVTGGLRALPFLLIAYSVATAFVPLYVYWISLELDASEAVARRAGWLVALSPAFVFWSGSLYKEGLTLLLLSVAAYHTLRLQSGWESRSVSTIAICVLGLWGVRFYLAILLAVGVVLSLLWGRTPGTGQSNRMLILVRQVPIIAAFVTVIMAVAVTVRTEHVLVESDEGILVNLDVRRAGSAKEASSGYLQEASIATPGEALQYLPLGVFYFLTVPFQWRPGALRQNLIIPENVVWLGLYPLIVIGISRSLRSNRAGTLFLLTLTAGMCVIYGLLAANVGTAYRMRSQVWLLWAPFAAWGWEVWRQRRARQMAALPRKQRRSVLRNGRYVTTS